MKTYLQQATPDERESLAKAVSSSVGYFYLIGGRHRKPGSNLCKALVAAEPKLTLRELRPDIWGSQPASAPSNPIPASATVRQRKASARPPP